MLSNRSRIAVAAAFLAGAPLITATLNDRALAAEPEFALTIETPVSNYMGQRIDELRPRPSPAQTEDFHGGVTAGKACEERSLIR